MEDLCILNNQLSRKRFVFPIIIAPFSLNFFTTVASIGALKPFRILLDAVHYKFLTMILSFIAIGRPSIEESDFPEI
jgi:hypothetical protein